MPKIDASEKFLTRFFQTSPHAIKLAIAVDAFLTASPDERSHAEALLKKTHEEIAAIPTKRLIKRG